MKRITISKRMMFEAAHFLPEHIGNCKRLHGHSFSIEVFISANEDELINGMIMDYADLKNIMQEYIIEKYDHRYLNDLIANSHPTSEVLGCIIFEDIKNCLPGYIALESITIKETENSACTVREENIC
jgi:6-pyruvoyltetrahydropterin/6-carboxytetrahydropterin synthase